MTRPNCAARQPASSPARWRLALGAGLFALALSAQCAALPWSLEALLRLPLERLLELPVTPQSGLSRHNKPVTAPRIRAGAGVSP